MSQPATLKPPKLKPGDTVAIISPSNSLQGKEEMLQKARANFEQATGLKTVLAPNALAHHHYSAGTRQQRLDDFHWALKNPEVKGIVFSVGGNTAVELVDGLDYELMRQHPKVIAGISDATTLLNAILAKTGLVTFLGLEFLDFAREPMDYEVASIKHAWFEGGLGEIHANPNWHEFNGTATTYAGWQTIRAGEATGRLVGGNFSSFAQLRATEYSPSVKGALLAMETYQYDKRKIHQCLAQLRLWGVFDQIAGLIVGYCFASDEPDIPGNDRSMADVVLEATDGYNFPVMQIGEIGHYVDNIMLPLGATANLNATNKTFTITEAVTRI